MAPWPATSINRFLALLVLALVTSCGGVRESDLFKAFESPVEDMVVGPTRGLMIASWRTLYFVSDTGKVEREIEFPEIVFAVVEVSKGDMLVATAWGGLYRLKDKGVPIEVITAPSEKQETPRHGLLRYDRKARMLLAGGETAGEDRVSLFTDDMKLVRDVGVSGFVTGLALDDGGRTLLVGTVDLSERLEPGTVEAFDVESGYPRWKLEFDHVGDILVHGDLVFVATSSGLESMRIKDGGRVKSLKLDHARSNRLDMSSVDGQTMIARAGWDRISVVRADTMTVQTSLGPSGRHLAWKGDRLFWSTVEPGNEVYSEKVVPAAAGTR